MNPSYFDELGLFAGYFQIMQISKDSKNIVAKNFFNKDIYT